MCHEGLARGAPVAGGAACILHYRPDQRLLCYGKTDQGYFVLTCSVNRARDPEFERLFQFVAKSIRVSDDAARHADETVEFPVTATKEK